MGYDGGMLTPEDYAAEIRGWHSDFALLSVERHKNRMDEMRRKMKELNAIVDGIYENPDIVDEHPRDAVLTRAGRDEAQEAYNKIDGNMRELERIEGELGELARRAESGKADAKLLHREARKVVEDSKGFSKAIDRAYILISDNLRNVPRSVR